MRLLEAPAGHGSEAIDEHERYLLQSIDKLTAVDVHLVITVKSGAAAPEDIAAYVRELMVRAGTTIGDAVSAVDVQSDRVTVRFSRYEEPPYYEIGDGHRVACHLYADGVTASLSERAAEKAGA